MVTKEEAIKIANDYVLKSRGKILPFHHAIFIDKSKSRTTEVKKIPDDSYWAVAYENHFLDTASTPVEGAIIVCVNAKTGAPKLKSSL